MNQVKVRGPDQHVGGEQSQNSSDLSYTRRQLIGTKNSRLKPANNYCANPNQGLAPPQNDTCNGRTDMNNRRH